MVYCPGESDQLAEIARRWSRAKIIVDHLNVRVGSHEIDRAITELEPLAEFPHVAVKLSALPCCVEDGYPFESLSAPVRRVVDAFGAERCMWGSDLTRLPCPYRDWVTAMAEGLGCLAREEIEWIMGRSLSQFLNWPLD
jgi:predicted TIM-barrel fold metal-dependent hydrolase